ncbi:hypothetical protein [Stieleria varia]|nr:hypothetical protein [Stieleria varia]
MCRSYIDFGSRASESLRASQWNRPSEQEVAKEFASGGEVDLMLVLENETLANAMRPMDAHGASPDDSSAGTR